MTNLKPCPCCGSTKIHVVAPDDGCYCWECGLTMPKRPEWRDRWNKRASILEPFPCSECEKPPRLVKNEEKGWSIGCCSTRFWWYDTKEEAIRDWNKHWRNRRVKE